MIKLHGINFICSVALCIILSASVLGLVNLSRDYSADNGQINIRNAINNPKMEYGGLIISNDKLEKHLLGNWVVKGQIQNTGSVQVSYYLVNINFFDKNGNYLNSSSNNLKNIKAGEIRDFEVEFKGNVDPDSYKIEL